MAGDSARLIDGIYEAAVIPDRWPDVLEQIGRITDTPAVVLLTRRSDSWVGHAISRPLEESMLSYLGTDIPGRTQTTARLIAADRAGFVTDEELYSREEWEGDPFRNEWGRRHGWDHAAATAIHVPSGDLLVFHAQRREGQAGFTRHDVATLDSFRPHLARAGLLAARWRLQRLRAAAEALAMVGLPAAVLDGDGRVLAANGLIEAMTGHLRWLPHDRLALVDAHANALLTQALSGVSGAAASCVRSFAIRPSAGDAAIGHVVPMAGAARDVFDGGLAVLVLTPVTAPDAPDIALIRGLFDLSAAEAQVARALTRGKTINQIAAGAGVTRETVRSQVKAVMAKTGAGRQAEVAALLAGLPIVPHR